MIELLIACAFWGFGFVATVWMLERVDTPGVLVWRFGAATLLGLIAVLVFAKSWRLRPSHIKEDLLRSFWPGVWMFATIAPQTLGLLTTSASKSALLTVLYVVMVPVLLMIQGREKFDPWHFALVGVALFGVAVFQSLRWDAWSTGDSLTLLCAFMASLHILSIDACAKTVHSKFVLNWGQNGVTALLSLGLLPFGERLGLQHFESKTWIALFLLAAGSSLLAFYLQLRAQEKIKPHLASLLFLLESPFSAFFAYFLLSERFGWHQLIGGALVLTSCAGAILREHRRNRKWDRLRAIPPQ